MNIPQSDINRALGSLIGWIEQWRDASGAYTGFVIHRSERKRMKHIHDTAWTQAAMIRGYANLYRKSKQARWYEAMIAAADLQAERFEHQTGKYNFAGHEDDRFCSLVHCALANCALLDICDLVDKNRRDTYLQIVKENVERYWIPCLWVEDEGAFRFSETDYYSPGEDRFVVNCNCIAAECLLSLSRLTGNSRYSKYAVTFGQWLIEKCDSARNYYSQLRQQNNSCDPELQTITIGGLPYQYTPSQQTPDNCVCLYAGLSLRGVAALAEFTGNSEYNRIADETVRFLLAMRDSETRLFFHTTKGDRIVRYPQFIAGAGMTLVGIDRAKGVLSQPPDCADTVNSILRRTWENGSYPSFIGKNAAPRRKKKGTVWEDPAAAVNWNAQWFEYLSRIVENPKQIEVAENTGVVQVRTRRFLYCDCPRHVTIISWWPWDSMGLYFIKKGRHRAFFTLDFPALLRNVYHSFRKILARKN